MSCGARITGDMGQNILMNCTPHFWRLHKYYDSGFNLTAFSVALVAVILSLSGKFVLHFNGPLSRVSWRHRRLCGLHTDKERTTTENGEENKKSRLINPDIIEHWLKTNLYFYKGVCYAVF